MTIPCQRHRLGNSDVKIIVFVFEMSKFCCSGADQRTTAFSLSNLGRLREIPVTESVSISLSGRWVGPINTKSPGLAGKSRFNMASSAFPLLHRPLDCLYRK